jgi:CBS domain-containing protein
MHIPQVVAAMTPFPHSIELKASISEAREFMRSRHIRHLPVTNDNRLVGIITDRDIKLILSPEFGCPSEDELTVEDVYIDDIYVVDVSESLESVVEIMADRHIGSVLVTKRDKLAGIFTTTDACRCLGQFLRQRYSLSPDNDVA